MNQRALHHAPIAAGDRVLEIGFGGGDLLTQLLKKHKPGFVGGVDLSRDMVRLVSQRLRSYIKEGKLQLWEGSIEKLPIVDSDYDTLYSINTVYFWQDPAAALAECHRVLKSGGRLLLCFDAKEDLKLWAGHRYGFRLFEPEELEILLKKSGFQPIMTAMESNGESGRFFCMLVKKCT